MSSSNEASRSVVKTMQLLEALAHLPEAGVTELSRQLGMHKSTTYRFLNSLCELKYVYRDAETERYRTTLKLFELGSAVVQRIELWREANPIMEELAHETEETVHLAMLEDDKLVYLHKIESTQTLRVSMMSRIGHTAPLHCTGLGKCLLAFSPVQLSERIIERYPLTRFTETTITSQSELRAELERIRDRGYAVDNEEHEIGIRCVAAPIHPPASGSPAALSLSVPSVRLTEAEIARHARLVRAATERIEEQLNHKPDPRAAGRAGSRPTLLS